MSANLITRQEFSPSCPAGGTWWSCGYGTFFVGCCARDPCEITCAQGNLYPGAFDPAAYGKFPDATCGTGSKFYTCSAGETFWGCCKTNACAQSGCPDGDLEPAIINRPDLLSAYHATGGSTTVSGASSTSGVSSATATSPTSSTTDDASVIVANVPSSNTTSTQTDQKTPIAAIAGGAAGGAFALAVVAGLVVWLLCFRRKKKRNHESGVGMSDNQQSQQHNIHIRSKPVDAPPSYTSPNPGFDNTFYNATSHDPQDPRYVAYAHLDPNYASDNHHAYQQNHPHVWPQELPLSSPSTSPTPAHIRSHKSMYGHARGPSELSGDDPSSELDSAGELNPESPVLGGMWKGGARQGWDNGSIDGHVTGSNTPPQMWMAPQNWGSRGGTKPTAFQRRPGEWRGEGGGGVGIGLGVLDDDASEGSDRMDGQRAERRVVRGSESEQTKSACLR